MDNLNLKYIEGFAVQQVADGVWAIDDFGIDLMYLVVGSRQAVLIDTGMGFGNLRGVVEQLTDLPYVIINTHGHIDHAGGNDQFEDHRIFMNTKDWDLNSEKNLNSIDTQMIVNKNLKEEGFYGNIYYNKEKVYRFVKKEELIEGKLFSLGDRELEVFETPGHTRGSVVLLDRRNHILFSGDTVVSTPTLIYSDLNSTTVSEYHTSLKKLLALKEDINLIFPGHYIHPIGFQYIEDLYILAGKIVDGSIQAEKIDFSHMTKQHTIIGRYGKASIVYVKESI